MQAAADTYAQRILVKQTAMLKFWLPLGRMMGISRDYFERDFASDLTAKVSSVPTDDLQAPKPSVAIPAMEGLACSLDEPALREMYLNLLARASDKRQNNTVHPSFAQIIKELSSDEVDLLDGCLDRARVPLVRIKRVTSTGPHPGWVILHSHLMNIRELPGGEPIEDANLPGYVDNWVRLGLVNVSYDTYLANESQYSWVETRPELVNLREAVTGDGITVEYDKGVMDTTDFGRRFATAVRAPSI